MSYRITLAPKNEGIQYLDENGLYRFNISLKKNTWTLFLPGSFGAICETKILSKEERDTIIPRIVNYLEKIKWFGLFKKSYKVDVVDIG